MSESERKGDAVARAEGTSTSGPRALPSDALSDSAQLLTRLDQYDPDVSAGVAADAAARIRDLQAQLARVTAERDELRVSVSNLDRLYLAARERAETAEKPEIFMPEVPAEVVLRARAEAAEAALAKVTAERDHERHEKETVADASKAHIEWLREKLAAAEAALSALIAERESLAGTVERIEENYNHCYERAAAAEAALSAYQEKVEGLIDRWREQAKDITWVNGSDRDEVWLLNNCADELLAALASPRQQEQEHKDKEADHARMDSQT